MIVLFCCVGTIPPDVNESHYLPKAKSLWDPGFASGGDLFLQSGTSHWLFSAVAGLAATAWEFSSVAWVGRLATWVLLSFAWIRLGKAVEIPALLRVLSLLGWFLLNYYGHWSGEWFVGGFEAKSMAYPFVILGLAAVVGDRWNWCWIWMGVAVAWHPVVGGWAVLTAVVVWILSDQRRERLQAQIWAILFGLVVSSLGIVPALWGLSGSDREGVISAAQVHVYLRLPHHMSPHTFVVERNIAAGVVLVLFVLVTTASRLFNRPYLRTRSVEPLLIIAWSAIAASAIGWTIDRAALYGLRPDIAARLLRFYFFRWSDVVVPLAISLTCAKWLTVYCFQSPSCQLRQATAAGRYALVLVTIALSSLGVMHWMHLHAMTVPPADLVLMKSVGPFPVGREYPDEDGGSVVENEERGSWLTPQQSPPRHVDWMAVCQWIRENTPEDSLWLTPRHQQTFKWYAARAEVVNWKDVPQDNASIIEWYRRTERCKLPRDAQGKLRGWTTEELIELARQYRFQWVLVDRSYQELPPLLECKYPLLIDNRSFAIFYIPASVLDENRQTSP